MWLSWTVLVASLCLGTTADEEPLRLIAIGNEPQVMAVFEPGDKAGEGTAMGWPEGRAPTERAGGVSDIACAPGGALYGFDRERRLLLLFDSGRTTVVRAVPIDLPVVQSHRGIAVSPAGSVFVVCRGAQPELHVVDVRDGSTMRVCFISGMSRIESIAFADDGTLYASGDNAGGHHAGSIFTVNMTTGVAERLGAAGPQDADGIAPAPDGMVYVVDSNGREAKLWRFDPKTGESTAVGTTGLTHLGAITIDRPVVPVRFGCG
jgi:DNA-binding beta-propeller fold protein YncE